MGLKAVAQTRGVRARVSAEEWQTRVALAACHRLIAHFGIEDLSYNHLSARVPGEPEHLLVKSPTDFFDEVSASSLIKYDFDGRPVLGDDAPLSGGGLVIHCGLMRLLPERHAIFHTHSVANMGVSAQKCGLLPITQHAVRFYNRIAYHDFEGFEFDPAMTASLADDLGDRYTMILRNHGALVVGRDIPEAFVLHHFLEMACRAQIAALAGGSDVVMPTPEACEHAARQQEIGAPVSNDGPKDWNACLRLAERLDPSFRD